MRLTLLDLAERTGSDSVIGLIEEVVTVAPELSVIPVRVKSGTTYRITKRTGLPNVGFRGVNEGVEPGKSSYKSESRPMYFFDAQLEVDEAIVKGEGGEGNSLGSVLADESTGVMQAMGITLGAQVYQGKTADEDGFLGFNDQIPDGANFTVNASGTGTVGTAWLAWLDDGYKGVSFAVGNSGDMSLGSWVKQQITDSNNPLKKLMAWVSNMSFYIGLQVHSDQSLWRIKNLTAAAPLTDALGAAMVTKIPLARRNGLRWFMNRQTAFLLQNSRVTTAGTQGILYPDVPTALAGYPITITDSIIDGPAY